MTSNSVTQKLSIGVLQNPKICSPKPVKGPCKILWSLDSRFKDGNIHFFSSTKQNISECQVVRLLRSQSHTQTRDYLCQKIYDDSQSTHNNNALKLTSFQRGYSIVRATNAQSQDKKFKELELRLTPIDNDNLLHQIELYDD